MLRKNYSDGITATVGVACTICVRVVCFHAGAVVAVVGWSALEIEHGDVCCSDLSLSLLVVTVESKYSTCKQTNNQYITSTPQQMGAFRWLVAHLFKTALFRVGVVLVLGGLAGLD